VWLQIRAGLGAVGIKPAMPDYEESVEQFIRRNLGAEVFERLIEPFCSGVYAGDPSKLGMKVRFARHYNVQGSARPRCDWFPFGWSSGASLLVVFLPHSKDTALVPLTTTVTTLPPPSSE